MGMREEARDNRQDAKQQKTKATASIELAFSFANYQQGPFDRMIEDCIAHPSADACPKERLTDPTAVSGQAIQAKSSERLRLRSFRLS